MKRFGALLLSVALMFTLFAGCSGSKQQPEQTAKKESTQASQETSQQAKVEQKRPVIIWSWDKNFNGTILDKAISLYKKDHPDVTFENVDLSFNDICQKLTTGLSAQSIDALPDITLMGDNSIQNYLALYKEMFVDLTGKMPYDQFLPYKVAAGSYEGKNYSVPFDTGVAALYYRSDIFEKAGYKEADMQDLTWEKYIEMGVNIKKVTGKYLFPLYSQHAADGIECMLRSGGKSFFDDKGKLTIKDNPVLIKSMETLKAAYDAGIIKMANDWGGMVASLNDGSCASKVSAVWFLSSITAAADQKGLWRVAPPPRINVPDSKNAGNWGGSSWYVLKGSGNEEIAIDFLKTLFGGNVDFYNEILKEKGALCAYIPARSVPALSEPHEFFGGQKVFEVFSKVNEQVPAINYGAHYRDAEAALTPELVAYFKGEKDLTKALDDFDRIIRDQISK